MAFTLEGNNGNVILMRILENIVLFVNNCRVDEVG